MQITPRFFKKRAPEKVHATWYTWSSDLTDVAGITISIDEQTLKIEMPKNEALNLGVQLCKVREFLHDAVLDAATQSAGDTLSAKYAYNRGKYDALVGISKYLGLRK